MADPKVFLADGAVLLCEKSKGSTVELQSEDRGFSFNGVYFATNQDKIGVKHIPLFDHCQWNEDQFGKDICTVGAVRWYVTKDDTSLGEDLEMLTLDSIAVCGQALAKISPINNGQGLITVESEEEWAKIIQEQLRKLEADFKASIANVKDKDILAKMRLEFREKYIDFLRSAVNVYHPGEYDEYLGTINEWCDYGKQIDSDFLALMKKVAAGVATKEEKERYEANAKIAKAVTDHFRDAMAKLSRLLENYTGIPAEVMTTQACKEAGNGKDPQATLHNNLFGMTDENNDLIDFRDREISISAYLSVFGIKDEYDSDKLFGFRDDDAGYDFEYWFANLEPYCPGQNYQENLEDLYDDLVYIGLLRRVRRKH